MCDQSKAVVVNSLLCFIHNFRQHSQLQQLIDEYFNGFLHHEAEKLLKDILADSKPLPNGLHSKTSKPTSLLCLYDELRSSSHCPIFAAADLHILPMVVLEREEIGNEKLLLHEIKQLRFLLQSAHLRTGLEAACTSNSNSSCSSAAKTRPDPSRLHSSSLQINSNRLKTPVKAQPSVEEACNAQLATQAVAVSSASKCLTSTPVINNNNHCLQSLMLLTSPLRFTTTSPTKPASNTGGRRLDQAVRKLTDRLEARLDNGNCSREGQEDRMNTPSLSHNTSTTSAASNEAIGNDQNSDDDYYYYSTQDNNDNHHTANGGKLAEGNLGENRCSVVLTSVSAGKEAKAVEMDEDDEQDNISSSSLTKQTPVDGRNKRKPKKSPPNVGIGLPPAPSSNGLLFDGDNLSEDDELSLPLSEQSSLIAKDELRGTKDSSPSNDDDGVEKPFSCSHVNCQKKFTNKFLLKKHQFIHTGLRPHACPYCNKRFNRKDNLLRHKKTHLANALVQQEGGRKRHNMLYGVSQEDAGLDLFSTLKNSMSKKKKKKSGTKSENECGAAGNCNENKCGIEVGEVDVDVEMRSL